MTISILQKLLVYARLMRLDKPIGIFLLLWPTLMALWVAAEGPPPLSLLIVFILGVGVMRSFGCVINDLADRQYDGQVVRTKKRPLVMGEVSSFEAKCLLLGLLVIAFFLAIQLNAFAIMLSFPALLLALFYPFMKRYTHLPQVVLGVAFAFGIPMAFAAVNNALSPATFWLFVATVCWTIAFDTQYAMVDKEDDIRIGIKSTAILFGAWDFLVIFGFQCTFLGCLIYLGISHGFGFWYHIGLLGAFSLILYQQNLIQTRERDRCFKAFLNNALVGAFCFLGVFLEFCFRV